MRRDRRDLHTSEAFVDRSHNTTTDHISMHCILHHAAGHLLGIDVFTRVLDNSAKNNKLLLAKGEDYLLVADGHAPHAK